MSVRITTLCILLGILLAFSAIIGVGAYRFTQELAARAENIHMEQTLRRVEKALEHQVGSLAASARDWAQRDTVYRFVTMGDRLFDQENFTSKTLESLRVEHIVLFDRAGKLRAWSGTPLPPDISALERPEELAALRGILRTADGVLLVAGSPILRSDGSGPAAGTLVMTQALNIAHPSRQLRLPDLSLTARRWDDARTLPGFARAAPALTEDATITYFPLLGKAMVGFLRQDDLLGRPALLLRVERSRMAYHQEMRLFWFSMLVVFGICLLGSLLAVVLLDRLVLSRLTRLHGQMQVITEERNFAARVIASGDDEVAGLAVAMNGMLTALQQAEKAAVEREHAFLVTALDTLPFPMAIITPDYEIVYANTAMRCMLSRLPNHDLFQVVFIDPVTHTVIPRERRPVVRALAGEAYPSLEAIIELSESNWLHILAMAGCVRWGDEPAAVVIAIQDITELKHADKQKDEFLAVLSHELMTPLTSILGWAEMAAAHPEAVPREQLLAVVLRNARRQKRLVDDLLDMSRLMHRKLALEPVALDLRDVVEQCIENQAQGYHARDVEVAVTWEAETLPVHGDAIRLQQAIGNLLHNAKKFTGAGGRVTITGRREGGCAVVAVQDTGRGIPPKELARLFNPFRQVERSEEHGGLGLGLALVKGIIELHGGRISADSPGEGAGSTFTLTLPLHETVPEEAAAAGN